MFALLPALSAALLMQAAADTHTVTPVSLPDEKAVFATVESVDVVPARARIAGTIGELRVDEGDAVQAGDVLAVVVDDRLSPQIGALNAGVSALDAQLAQARIDLERARELAGRGILPQARLDEAETNVQVLQSRLESARQERAVVVQQSREGDVLAPAAGRVLSVPVTAGSVIMPGEPIAMLAAEQYVLRLRLPERHARFIAEGDAVRVDAAALTGGVAERGSIIQVYPGVESGRVIADAAVAGLGDYFVGERVRVWVETEPRERVMVPEAFLSTRYGVDYARVRDAEGATREIAVQRGRAREGQVEILAGLGAGDVLVQP